MVGLNSLITSFPWTRYSKKLNNRIDKLRCAGTFTQEEAEARDVRLVIGSAGSIEDGNLIKLYWLVDREDGIIIDAKFQVYGQSALLGAAETVCELLVGKNYDQAKRISAHLIDQQVQDRSGVSGFPYETTPHLNLVLDAVDVASEQCNDIPLAPTYVATPMPIEMGEVLEGGYPGWEQLSIPQKIAIIEQVLDRDVRPYIALDAGGVEVVNLIEGRELIIAYQGSCTSCYSSVGTTLTYIQQVLRAKVHPTLNVTPKL